MQCKTLFLAAVMLAGALAMGATPPTEPAKGKDLRWEGSPQIAELSGCTPGCTPGVGACPSGGCVDLCPVGRILTVQGVDVIPGGTGDPVASGKKVAFPPTVRLHEIAGRFPMRCDCDPNVWGTDKEAFVTSAGAFTQNPTAGNVAGAAVNDRAGACWSTPVAITDVWGMCGSSHAEVMQGAVSAGSVTTKHLPPTGIWNTTDTTPPLNQYLTCRNVLDVEESRIALELRGSPPARLRGSEWPEAPSTWTAGTWGGSGTALDYDDLSQFGTESVQTLSLSTTYCTSASAAGCNSGGAQVYYSSVTPVLYADPNATGSTYKNPIDAIWKPWVNEVKRDYTLTNYPPRTDAKNGVGKTYKALHRVTATAAYSPTDVYSFSEQDDRGILRCGPMLGEPDTTTQSNANAQRVCHYAPSRLLTVADGECLEGATPNNGSCTENLDMMPNDDRPDFSAWVSGPLYAKGGSPAELMEKLSCGSGSKATLYSSGYPVAVGCRYVRAAGTCTQTVTYTIPHCSGSCCSGKTQAAWPDCSCSGTCTTPTDPDPPDTPDTTCLCSDKSECPNDDRSQCPSCTCNDGSLCPSGDRAKCPADKPKGCDSTKECCSNPCGSCQVQGGHPNCSTCTDDDTLPGCGGCDSTTTCCTTCNTGQTQKAHPDCGCEDPPAKLCSDGSECPGGNCSLCPCDPNVTCCDGCGTCETQEAFPDCSCSDIPYCGQSCQPHACESYTGSPPNCSYTWHSDWPGCGCTNACPPGHSGPSAYPGCVCTPPPPEPECTNTCPTDHTGPSPYPDCVCTPPDNNTCTYCCCPTCSIFGGNCVDECQMPFPPACCPNSCSGSVEDEDSPTWRIAMRSVGGGALFGLPIVLADHQTVTTTVTVVDGYTCGSSGSVSTTAYIERAVPPSIKEKNFYTFGTAGARVQANQFDEGSKALNTLECPLGYVQADSGACIEYVPANATSTPTSATRYPQVPAADCDATFQHCPCNDANANECPDEDGALIPAVSGCTGQGNCRGTAVAAVATSAKVQPTIEVAKTTAAGKDRRVIYGDSAMCCSGCKPTETCTQPADCTGAGTPHTWCSGAGTPPVRSCYCDAP